MLKSIGVVQFWWMDPLVVVYRSQPSFRGAFQSIFDHWEQTLSLKTNLQPDGELSGVTCIISQSREIWGKQRSRLDLDLRPSLAWWNELCSKWLFFHGQCLPALEAAARSVEIQTSSRQSKKLKGRRKIKKR